jgi:hypothetical protein
MRASNGLCILLHGDADEWKGGRFDHVLVRTLLVSAEGRGKANVCICCQMPEEFSSSNTDAQ